MAHYILVSDKPLEGYEQFLTGALDELRKHRVLGLAMVAFLEPEESGDDILTGYYGLNLRGKQEAAMQIQADVTDGIVRANVQRYLEEIEREREEEE
ncbi:MAG: hypothetical protein MRZ73_12430 [Pseudoflavonifractor capillosus]|uniref:hypothetical protein n=1 Tax=Pseudoflavonifractor capillosus TaxID=106588 RepID=UPI0023F62DEE|nr:hypothetical protein [Pseudoflavonifractor capillosus]MCI5929317.1 hypothetical protein [Pseudoflavonifractor capillosus]MDY4661261.1 hypothetical protein [Pseudoflavonifractor capillosus]